MFAKSYLRIVVFWLITAVVTFVAPVSAWANSKDNEVQQQLERGEVVVGIKNIGATKYVSAQVLIDASPDQIWPILANPFEFKGKIMPRVKTVEVVADQKQRSVLKFTMDAIIIPHFTYTVESLYENAESIQFHSTGGMLKDLRGSWIVTPVAGEKTELTYCMYVDPGMPVPQWIIRQVLKGELPKTLTALRERIQNISRQQAIKEEQTILAAYMVHNKIINHSAIIDSTAENLPVQNGN